MHDVLGLWKQQVLSAIRERTRYILEIDGLRVKELAASSDCFGNIQSVNRLSPTGIDLVLTTRFLA